MIKLCAMLPAMQAFMANGQFNPHDSTWFGLNVLDVRNVLLALPALSFEALRNRIDVAVEYWRLFSEADAQTRSNTQFFVNQVLKYPNSVVVSITNPESPYGWVRKAEKGLLNGQIRVGLWWFQSKVIPGKFYGFELIVEYDGETGCFSKAWDPERRCRWLADFTEYWQYDDDGCVIHRMHINGNNRAEWAFRLHASTGELAFGYRETKELGEQCFSAFFDTSFKCYHTEKEPWPLACPFEPGDAAPADVAEFYGKQQQKRTR